MVKTAGCGSVMRGFESHYPPHLLISVGVSPSGKATDSDSVMRRFESCYPSQNETAPEGVLIYFGLGITIGKDSNLKRPRREAEESGGLFCSRVSKATERGDAGRRRGSAPPRKSCYPSQNETAPEGVLSDCRQSPHVKVWALSCF